MRVRAWEINLTEIQGLSASGKFLGIQWQQYVSYKNVLSKIKDKLLYLVLPTTKIEV